MPTRHLTDDQRRSFAGDPAPEPLARFFGLDGPDRDLIGERRGEHNRLGFAAMLTGVRFLGAFPGATDDMPRSVPETLREPLGLGRAASLNGRFEGRSRVRRRSATASGSRTSATTPERAFGRPAGSTRLVLERRRSARTADRPDRRSTGPPPGSSPTRCSCRASRSSSAWSGASVSVRGPGSGGTSSPVSATTGARAAPGCSTRATQPRSPPWSRRARSHRSGPRPRSSAASTGSRRSGSSTRVPPGPKAFAPRRWSGSRA